MKSKYLFSAVLLGFLATGCVTQEKGVKVKETLSFAEQQTQVMLKEIKIATQQSGKNDQVSPRTLNAKGELVLVASRDWTSGFFPGVLWFLYQGTGQQQWADEARRATAQIEQDKLNGRTHDMGFKVYCSFGTGYRLTKDPNYRNVILQSAKTLSTRFYPKVGTLLSWDHSRDKWKFPVIIDNMMNLELLFAATKLSGDSSYYKIAVSHANTTMKNHFRPDYSSYHVIDYDSATGKVLKKNTHQGYAHESAWSRGQAWALYGYTMCYRETKNPAYLKQAENVAAFILNHPNLPADLIPYYDFNAPGIPNEPRDASAGALNASALYELSLYSRNGKLYRAKADQMLASLNQSYRPQVGGARGFLLLHSTGSKPSNSEVDVPLSYADYYFMEALLRQQELNKTNNLDKFFRF
jgi:unsaturated chondroitin disaccharide hydrolase